MVMTVWMLGNAPTVLNRDGNSTRGCGYPRILNPMDAGAGLIFHPWVDPHPSGKKNHNLTFLDKVHPNYPNYKMST